MPVTGWLRGTVKAVPSGDTVLIVANAGPTVRRCIFTRAFARLVVCFIRFFETGGRVKGSSPSRRDRSFLSLFAFFFGRRRRPF